MEKVQNILYCETEGVLGKSLPIDGLIFDTGQTCVCPLLFSDYGKGNAGYSIFSILGIFAVSSSTYFQNVMCSKHKYIGNELTEQKVAHKWKNA